MPLEPSCKKTAPVIFSSPVEKQHLPLSGPSKNSTRDQTFLSKKGHVPFEPSCKKKKTVSAIFRSVEKQHARSGSFL
jgi:hypothetical protein